MVYGAWRSNRCAWGRGLLTGEFAGQAWNDVSCFGVAATSSWDI